MCQYGQTKLCRVFINPQDSYTGKGRWTEKLIDACLVNQINQLNASGQLTRSCCCGHGKTEGTIILQDGSRISIPKKDI